MLFQDYKFKKKKTQWITAEAAIGKINKGNGF